MCECTILDIIAEKWQNKGIDLELIEIRDSIYIKKIIIPEDMRGVGLSRLIVNDVVNYAKCVRKKVTLIPSDLYGTEIKKLKKIYKKLGFVENGFHYEHGRC